MVWADLAGSPGSYTVAVRYARPSHDELVARVDSAGRRLWYVTDRVGSVVAVVEDGGAAVKRIKDGGYKADDVWTADDVSHTGYTPNTDGSWSSTTWQQTTAQMNAVKADRWYSAAREYDAATGLQFIGGRFYDDETGRFLSENANALSGSNAYRYAGNSPKNVAVVKAPRGDGFQRLTDFAAN